MAETTSKIKLIFEGAERGVAAAAAKSAAAVKGLTDEHSRLNAVVGKSEDALGGVARGLLAVGAVGSAVNTIGGVAGALTQLAPAALVLPGVLLGGAAAMQTFKLATDGFGDAIGAGLSGDMAKFAESTKDMAPEMRKAAAAVVAFRPEINKLKKDVQGEFWDDFSGQITKLGKIYLPILDDGLSTISRSLGGVAYSATKALESNFFQDDVTQILDNTGQAVENATDSVGNLISGFVGLGAVGSTYLPRLGKWIDDIALKFKKWVDSGVEDGTFIRWIDTAIQGFKDLWGIVTNVGSILGSVFSGLGGQISSPLAALRDLTGQFAAFLKTAEGQKIIADLGHIIQQVGEGIGIFVGWVRAAMPAVQGLVGALGGSGNAIRDLTPLILGAVVAIKALKVASNVAGWVSSATNALRGFGGAAGKAAEESGRAASIAWGKGFTGGLALVGVGVGGTIILDKVLPMDAAKTHGSQAARDMLHEMASVFQGEGNIFQAWDLSRWISNPISMAVEVGRRELAKLWENPPPPIPVKVDTQPASKAFTDWQSHVGDGIATAHLDADPSRAMGTVHDWEGGVSRTRGVAQLDADASRGNNVLGGWKGSANATVGTASLNANPAGANSTRSGWQSAANGTVGTARLDANPGQANGALGGWRGSANATVGTARLNANTGAATAAINTWRNWASGIVVTVKAVLSKIGFANGGPVLPGMATGGPISGPGTGTSDQAGMFALSAGEWVMTADQVRRAGGFAGMAKIAAALDRGGSLGLAEGGGIRASARAAMRAPAPSSAGSSGGSTVVQFTGNTSDALATVIMGMIRQGKIQIKAA